MDIYEFLNHDLLASITNNIFKVSQTISFDLRKQTVLQSRNPSSLKYCTRTMSYLAPKIRPLFPKQSKIVKILNLSQPAFTCSKLTIETLEQGVKYVQS